MDNTNSNVAVCIYGQLRFAKETLRKNLYNVLLELSKKNNIYLIIISNFELSIANWKNKCSKEYLDKFNSTSITDEATLDVHLDKIKTIPNLKIIVKRYKHFTGKYESGGIYVDYFFRFIKIAKVISKINNITFSHLYMLATDLKYKVEEIAPFKGNYIKAGPRTFVVPGEILSTIRKKKNFYKVWDNLLNGYNGTYDEKYFNNQIHKYYLHGSHIFDMMKDYNQIWPLQDRIIDLILIKDHNLINQNLSVKIIGQDFCYSSQWIENVLGDYDAYLKKNKNRDWINDNI